MKKATSKAASPSGIFVIEISSVSQNNQWVLDTDCGLHICIDLQGLRNCRRLNKGELDVRVGNGTRVAALFIRTYVLNLPSGILLNLDDCYYVPTLTKNIIAIS